MGAWFGALVLVLSSVAATGCVSPWHTSAYSLAGRPIKLHRVGHGPQRVLWIGGIHGNEPEGAVATDQLPDAITETPGLQDQVTVILVRDLNPDGRATGTRTNANGVDLNRNFPARNFSPSREHLARCEHGIALGCK